MSRIYVIARVPAAARSVCEQLVQPLLASPNSPNAFTFSVPLVPAAGPDDAQPVAFGACAPMLSEEANAALPPLAAGVPGVAYQSVPWREYDTTTHWLGWLTAAGLKPQKLPV